MVDRPTCHRHRRQPNYLWCGIRTSQTHLMNVLKPQHSSRFLIVVCKPYSTLCVGEAHHRRLGGGETSSRPKIWVEGTPVRKIQWLNQRTTSPSSSSSSVLIKFKPYPARWCLSSSLNSSAICVLVLWVQSVHQCSKESKLTKRIIVTALIGLFWGWGWLKTSLRVTVTDLSNISLSWPCVCFSLASFVSSRHRWRWAGVHQRSCSL